MDITVEECKIFLKMLEASSFQGDSLKIIVDLMDRLKGAIADAAPKEL